MFLERKLLERDFKYFRCELIINVLYYIHVGIRQRKNEIEGSENTTLRRSLERAYILYSKNALQETPRCLQIKKGLLFLSYKCGGKVISNRNI